VTSEVLSLALDGENAERLTAQRPVARLSSEPVQGGPVHPKSAGNVYDRVAGVEPLDSLPSLMRAANLIPNAALQFQ
jgi:hypothetical protein